MRDSPLLSEAARKLILNKPSHADAAGPESLALGTLAARALKGNNELEWMRALKATLDSDYGHGSWALERGLECDSGDECRGLVICAAYVLISIEAYFKNDVL